MQNINIASLRRQQLIEATMECVDEHGINGTTISKISKHAGVSNGVVHHYFHNKDDLLEATMRLMLEHLKQGILKRKLTANNHYECIVAIIEGNFSAKQIEHKSTKIWCSFWAEALHQPALWRLEIISKSRMKSNLAYHLKHLVPKSSANIVASTMASLIAGLWLHGAFDEDGIDVLQARKLCLNYLDLELNAA